MCGVTMKVQGILPYVKLSGTHEEIGYQHGKLLRDRVRDCYTFYTRELFNDPGFDFEASGRRFLDFIGEHFPHYALEIEGIAQGSGLAPWQISVLNARTEVFLQANAALINECTALYFAEERLLGQNWDWMMPCEDLIVLMEIEKNDGHRILMMTEPGIIGKIGFNDAGLGVCLNILLGHEGFTAMPVHIMLRALLDSRSVNEARDLLIRTPMDTFSHVLVGDCQGASLSMEFAGTKTLEVDYGGEIPLHTNHYLSEERDADHIDVIVDSRCRMKRARELLDGIEQTSFDMMKKVLLDDADGEHAICKQYTPIWNLEHGTICSLIMDLPRRTLHITKGNPHRAGGYTAFTLD
jgi:isopenicillin-N N-acyltransferase-like protein